MLQDCRHILAVFRIHRQSDTRRGIELEPLVLDRVFEGRRARLCDLDRERTRSLVPQQNHELIAAEAPHRHVLDRAFVPFQGAREIAGHRP